MKTAWKKHIQKLTGLLLITGLVLSETTFLFAQERQSNEIAGAAVMTVGEVPSYDTVTESTDADAFAALYDSHMGIDFADALSISSENPGNLSALEALPEGKELTRAVKAYEAQKTLYLLNRTSAEPLSREVLSAWSRQKDLNTFYYGYETSEVVALIPSVSAMSAEKEQGEYRLEMSEWMTVGYNDSAVSDVINFTAYRLEFTLTVRTSDYVVTNAVNDETLFAEMDENTDAIIAVNEKEAASSELNQFSSSIRQSNALPSYNPAGAVAYAQQWATARNPAFSDYTGRGGDCANFVSQCLCAGGLPSDGTWYKDSKAWIAVIALSNWLCNTYGLPRLVADNSNIQPGSPVCYQWHSNWQSSYKLNHVTICTGYNAQGVPVVCGHTRDIRDVAWQYGYGDTSYMTIPLSASASPVNTLPKGYLDEVTGGFETVKVKGWAFDPDHPDDPVTVRIYMDGPAGQGTCVSEFKAKKKREDLTSAGICSNPKHGFEKTISLKARGKHTFYACAVDLDDANQIPNLSQSPVSASVLSSYYAKIPAMKQKVGKTKIYKINFGGVEWDDVEWFVKNEDIAVCELDSSAEEEKVSAGRKKSWVKIAVTGEKKGTTKLVFRILDEDGEVRYKKSATITITKPKAKKK